MGRSAKFVTVVLSWLLLLFMITAGLWMVKLGLYGIVLQNRILVDFRPVAGRVITSRVVRAKDARDYSPRIGYTYQVNNRHFRSHETTIFDQHGSLEWAERIVARFPAGQPCRVFVSPADPNRSVLIRRSGIIPFLAVLIGIVLLWAAGPTFKALQREISRQPRSQRSRGTVLSRRMLLIGHLFLGTAPVTGVCWSYFLIYPPPHLWWMGAIGISSAFISACIPVLAWWPELADRIAHSASSVGFLFFAIAPFIYLLTGFAAVREQHRAINAYVPVRGAVISSGVAGDQGGFTPAIAYSYHFRKRQYVSARYSVFAPLPCSHGRAMEIAAKYPVGNRCTVYVDPQDALKAVLRRRVDFIPYSKTALGLWLTILVFILFLHSIAENKFIAEGDPLQPTLVRSLRRKFVRTLIIAGTLLLPTLALLADYYHIAKHPDSIIAAIDTVICAASVLLVSRSLLKIRMLAGLMDDPFCHIAPCPAAVNSPVACVVSGSFKKPIHVEEVRLVLQCTRGTLVVWEQSQVICQGQDFNSGGQARWAAEFSIPHHVASSGHYGRRSIEEQKSASPEHRWLFRSRTVSTILRDRENVGMVRRILAHQIQLAWPAVDCHWQFRLVIRFRGTASYSAAYRFAVAPATGLQTNRDAIDEKAATRET